MTASTLIVSLDGIELGGVTEVVQARGIDRVIVVASSNDFNNFANQSTKNNVVNIKNAGAKVELALNTGSSLSLSDAAYENIRSAGLTFLNDPGLTSFSGALIASKG